MIGMQIARDKAKGHRLIGGTLDLARTEHPSGIPIQQQAQQHFGGIRLSSTRPIVGIQRPEVQLGHAVHHEASQMVRRQTVTQPYCQIQCLVIVHGFECSFHAYSLPLLTGARHLLLSDKLLVSSPALGTVMRLPIRQIQLYLLTLHGVTISIGEIVELLHRMKAQMQPQLDALKTEIRASPAVQADETGWREDGSNGYIWSVSTPSIRYYE